MTLALKLISLGWAELELNLELGLELEKDQDLELEGKWANEKRGVTVSIWRKLFHPISRWVPGEMSDLKLGGFLSSSPAQEALEDHYDALAPS